MTGAALKFSAAAAAIGLSLGLLMAPNFNSAFAQNEPEPETAPLQEPQAEPTEFSPITAGDAERGAPPSPEAAPSPASEATPAPSPPTPEASSPSEAALPSSPASAGTPAHTPWRTTISRERQGVRGRTRATTGAKKPTARVTPLPDGISRQAGKASKRGGGPQIVPENSPFAGMNFGNQKGPIPITSDTATLDYQNKSFLFAGHVHAVQAGGDLLSDTLRVQYGNDFNDVRMIYADGHVRMSQGTRWITSDHAVLDQGKHILTFHGNPVVHDGEDQITGSLITVDLVSGKSTVQNPRVVIFPRESKNPDNGDAPESP